MRENIWREIPPMREPRNGASCLHVRSAKAIFVFGGNNYSSGILDSIERFDLEINKWSYIRTRLPYPVQDFALTLLSPEASEIDFRRLILGGKSIGEDTMSKPLILDLSIELKDQ